jgi:predicted  nucleic acid-binding Zn-ribbon protein
MSDTHSSSRDSPQIAPPATAATTAAVAARTKAAREIVALVQLAELDAALIAEDRGREAKHEKRAQERHGLAAKLSPELLEAYNRVLRAGRRPAVVRLALNVCSGCHVRLHSTLEQRIRRRRGVGACPHCLRLVYDTAWLHAADARK